MAKIVQLTTLNNEEVCPQTLMSLAFRESGESLEKLILTKDNITEFTPTQDYQPATKSYVDSKQKLKIIMSIQPPSNIEMGAFWYQLPAKIYTFTEISDLNRTFNDIDAQNLTWAEADLGGW